jgi:hypothetical protein
LSVCISRMPVGGRSELNADVRIPHAARSLACEAASGKRRHDDAVPIGHLSTNFGGVSFFWLKYRYPNGQFAGAVVIEATGLVIARLEATVFGLDDGLVFAGGQEIDDASAHQIPESMIDRLLDLRDLRRLRLLLTKKPQAPSVKASPGRTPQRTDVGPRRRPKPVPARRRRG